VKFLADMGVSSTTVDALRNAGYDATHLRDEGLITLPDSEILAKANREGRIVLTFDLDFGDLLAASKGSSPSVILFRLRNQTPPAVTPRLFSVLGARAAELKQGAIVIVEEDGYRLRRLPISSE
jgi:predicted nuclease of predicted toxin-antitoxin system